MTRQKLLKLGDVDPLKATVWLGRYVVRGLVKAGIAPDEARSIVLGRLAMKFAVLGPGPRAAVLDAVANGIDADLAAAKGA